MPAKWTVGGWWPAARPKTVMGLFVSLAVTTTTGPLNGWAVGTATAMFLASTLLLVWAVRPRLGVGGRGQQEYFAHFARFVDRTDDLARELACVPDDVNARKAAQLTHRIDSR
ncbi:Pycsar system effector family protein [Micromonospora sp. NPDC005367]|uniref:Pycsar system effector family protein n=1 Tax=Micromonospora sp. NPDC005367 TaxID=3155590 RepID=UPI0033AA6CB0